MTSQTPQHAFDQLLREGSAAVSQGWDFSFLNARLNSDRLPWVYEDLARREIARSARVLDIDTGGGELFAALYPPAGSTALEPYPPNLPVAAECLEPLGIDVRARTGERYPVADEDYDLVLNRHAHLGADEIYRTLMPGGGFLTQQVGRGNDREFNDALGVPEGDQGSAFGSADELAATLHTSGLTVTDAREAWITCRYLDIGAVVFQLLSVPWQAPGFSVTKHREALQRIDNQIATTGAFEVTSLRIFAAAVKGG